MYYEKINQTQQPIQVEPLVYLALLLANKQSGEQINEQTSGANAEEGYYYNSKQQCDYFDKKQIKVFIDKYGKGSVIPCNPLTSSGVINDMNEIAKNNPDYIKANEKLKDEVKNKGWKDFLAGLSDWAKTDTGTDVLNTVGLLASGTLGQQNVPDIDVNAELDKKKTSQGLSPVVWVAIALGTLFILGGVGFAIYKYSVKKKQVITV